MLDLNQVLGGIEKMLRRVIGEDIELTTNPATDLRTGVFVDPAQVEQVILNLAVNARDAMPDGGNLTLETENVFLSDDYARLHNEVQAGWYVVLTVSDTGCGMDDVISLPCLRAVFHDKGVLAKEPVSVWPPFMGS